MSDENMVHLQFNKIDGLRIMVSNDVLQAYDENHTKLTISYDQIIKTVKGEDPRVQTLLEIISKLTELIK